MRAGKKKEEGVSQTRGCSEEQDPKAGEKVLQDALPFGKNEKYV